MTNAEILAALAKRFAAPEFAFLTQVRSRTGYGGDIRTADAMAMCLYPSRGLELHGLEIKVSRSDWLREKKAPEKAEEIARYCDRWWLVVGDEAIVQPGELPPAWGLMAPRGKGLVAKVEAPALSPPAAPRHFLAAILRNVAEAHANTIPLASVADEINKARFDGVAVGEERQREALERIRKSVDAFEAASGVRIEHYNGERLGEAVKFVLESGVDLRRHQLEVLRERALSIANDIGKHLETVGGER